MQSKRVLIADDHFAIRSGVRSILTDEITDIEFGEATNAAELFQKIKGEAWDALILDVNLPDKNGLEILKQIKSEAIRVPVLVFSMHSEEQIAVRALRAGAAGYLCKTSADFELGKAVNLLLTGRKYITSSVAELLLSHFDETIEKAAHELLSDREYQTLILIAAGKSVSQIAAELSLGVPTISTYRARILEKMRLKNNAEITHYVIENRLT